jgi:kynurenine formamidase
MADFDINNLPSFADLPVKDGAPPDSAWGLFGDDDGIGTVNLLTADGVVKAASLVNKGSIFRLDTKIAYADPPLFERTPTEHVVTKFPDFFAFDDMLNNYNTQEGAQWDGLAHAGHPVYNAWYNGTTLEEIKAGNERLSIDKWADKMVGRGVLIDVFKHRADIGQPVDPGTTFEYTVEDLEAARQAQGVEINQGDILLVRTGWLQHYYSSTPEAKKSMGTIEGLESCGLHHGREMAAYFWDNHIAAVGTDCPAVETWPWKDFESESLHYRTLALLGLPIGEQFDLEKLAADSASDGVYESMVVSVPMNLEGGIASPPNAVAIK